MMKKRLGLVLGLFCAASLALSGCAGGGGSAADPDKAVSSFVDEIKKGNVEKAQSYLVSPESVEGMEAIAQAESNRIKESAGSLSYEIASSTMFEKASEVVEGAEESEAEYGGALVVVNVTNKDMAKVSEKLAAAMQAEAGNFATMSEKDMEKFWNNAIKSALSETTEVVTTPVDFVVVEEGRAWKIKEADDFFSAAFGAGAFLDF